MQARTLALPLVLTAVLSTGHTQAGEILRWVDAEGVTHFGDRNSAPTQGADVIDVRKANGMDAPDTDVLVSQNSPRVMTLSRPELRNQEGWRGFGKNGHSRKGQGVR
ncbi:MAG: DUF4124 domain-containing protein [Pseudomonadales bacterium]|nr:DUF4124 domain-containing protein [Pseudomonadales bacterium]MCP5185517.1 DUF4124 domain-containing protein [Pseudomonadales bacterium]